MISIRTSYTYIIIIIIMLNKAIGIWLIQILYHHEIWSLISVDDFDIVDIHKTIITVVPVCFISITSHVSSFQTYFTTCFTKTSATTAFKSSITVIATYLSTLVTVWNCLARYTGYYHMSNIWSSSRIDNLVILHIHHS